MFLALGAALLAGEGAARAGEEAYTERRMAMSEQQLKMRDVHAPRVLEAMGRVKRHLFVPEEFRELAYTDQALPIGRAQTISQPYIVAYMTQAA